MTCMVNVHEAKTHLSKLLRRVMNGGEIVIAKAGKPIARLTPYTPHWTDACQAMTHAKRLSPPILTSHCRNSKRYESDPGTEQRYRRGGYGLTPLSGVAIGLLCLVSTFSLA